MHLAYFSGGALYYMKSADGFATVPAATLIDAAGGEWLSMALNPNTGIPHVVYFDSVNDSLKYTYATNAAGTDCSHYPQTMAGKSGNGIVVDTDNRAYFYEMNAETQCHCLFQRRSLYFNPGIPPGWRLVFFHCSDSDKRPTLCTMISA